MASVARTGVARPCQTSFCNEQIADYLLPPAVPSLFARRIQIIHSVLMASKRVYGFTGIGLTLTVALSACRYLRTLNCACGAISACGLNCQAEPELYSLLRMRANAIDSHPDRCAASELG
jgi:hypothetical protein